MARCKTYHTKGEEALTARLDVPVTKALKMLLAAKAEKAGVSMTEYARNILIAGMAQ